MCHSFCHLVVVKRHLVVVKGHLVVVKGHLVVVKGCLVTIGVGCFYSGGLGGVLAVFGGLLCLYTVFLLGVLVVIVVSF